MICATIEDVARRMGISAYAKRASVVVLLFVLKRKNNAGVMLLIDGIDADIVTSFMENQKMLTI